MGHPSRLMRAEGARATRWLHDKTRRMRRPSRTREGGNLVKRSLVVACLLVASLAGCNHKKWYLTAEADHKDDIGYVAAYAPLLDGQGLPAGTGAEVTLDVEDLAMDVICRHAKSAVPPLNTSSTKQTDAQVMSDLVGYTLMDARNACCPPDYGLKDDKLPSEKRTACGAAVKIADSSLAKMDADAVKEGLPAHTMSRIDAASVTPAAKAEIEAIMAAITPTPDQARLAAIWADPKAKPDDISELCKTAMPSQLAHPGPDASPAEEMKAARDAAIAGQCIGLIAYESLADLEVDCEKLEKSGGHCSSSICSLSRTSMESRLGVPACLADTVQRFHARCK
jgi:hypothetical protein